MPSKIDSLHSALLAAYSGTLDAGLPSLLNVTFSEITEGLEKGRFTSTDLVKAYLQRIKEVDGEFRSIIEVNPDALQIAQRLDEERRTLGARSRLHGIPLLIKDNIVTLDSMNTTCGSFALLGADPAKESAVITGLRAAGAIMLAKTNMSEWSGARSTSRCSGWSARGGQSRGIFYPNMNPSGSSSGSAIATALGLGFAALGTETTWNIVSPAEQSGVVGFKPTRDLIPTAGIIYTSQAQDSIGLLTRTVKDAAYMLQEIIHCTSKDEGTFQGISSREDLIEACSKPSLRGVRIGLSNLNEVQTTHLSKQLAFGKALRLFKSAGAEIVPNVEVPGTVEYAALHPLYKHVLLAHDMKAALNTYFQDLRTNPQGIESLGHLVSFLKWYPDEEFPERDVDILERVNFTHPQDTSYRDMLTKDRYLMSKGGIDDALQDYNVDALVVPTLSPTLQTFAARAGSPILSLPMGCYPPDTEVEIDPGSGLVNVAPGIPFSLYVFGATNKDANVLKVAQEFEQLSGLREKLEPYLVPKTELRDIR